MPNKLWPPARRNCRSSEATTHAASMLLIELEFFAIISEKRMARTCSVRWAMPLWPEHASSGLRQ